jgi:hemoglobin
LIARHFDRWLALFEETAWELCPPKAAEHLVMLTHRIAESLELGAPSQGRALYGGVNVRAS